MRERGELRESRCERVSIEYRDEGDRGEREILGMESEVQG